MKLLVFSGKVKRILLVFWALMIFYFYLGTIINFHQHRIWGKQLIPETYATVRGKDKFNLSLAVSLGVSLSSFFTTDGIGDLSKSVYSYIAVVYALLVSISGIILSEKHTSSVPVLRGPPSH